MTTGCRQPETSLRSWLECAGLLQYHKLLSERGVTVHNFTNLAIRDFPELGIKDATDRMKLWKLVEVVKQEMAHPSSDPPYSPDTYSHDDFEVHSVDDGEVSSPRDSSPIDCLLPKKTSPPKIKAKIRVVVRKRPLNKRELGREETDVVSVEGDAFTVMVHEPKVKVDMTKYIERHEFVFDEVFDESVSNADLYAQTAKPLVASVFEGAKATCFAYGQTGSGKTHTMMGPDQSGADGEEQGLYAMAARDLFAQLHEQQHHHLAVHVSFFEIYGGKLFDLLNDRRHLVAREDRRQAVCIVGLQERDVDSVKSLLQLIKNGSQLRSTGSTGANIDSSRSHAILQITLAQRGTRRSIGRLSFIDLAGSERGVDTVNQDKRTRIEGAEINKSLLALKECIRAQDQNHKHTPFRGSKLTQVLKDSFVGNCRTIMVANISPNSGSCEHTLNTLRYADRVKELKKLAREKPARDAYMPHRVATPPVLLPAQTNAKPHESQRPCLLEEEEALISAHKNQVDEIMRISHEEIALVKRFDGLECSADEYLSELDALLHAKGTFVANLRLQLARHRQQRGQDDDPAQS